MSNRVFDKFTSIVMFIIGITFVWGSQSISESSYGSNVGPDIFPTVLGILLILLSIRLFFEVMKLQKNNKEEGEKLRPDHKRFSLILGAAFLYAYFLEDIGYVIGTFVFLLFSFQVIERGKWISSLIISVCFSCVIYYLFVKVLQGTLPGFPEWLQLSEGAESWM